MNARCDSCGAPIVWAKTRSGKAIPVNVDPSPSGNLALRDGVAVVVTAIDGMNAPHRYLSHFATCPHAGQWRRGGR